MVKCALSEGPAQCRFTSLSKPFSTPDLRAITASTNSTTATLTAWFITDNKAGHRNQLQGLEQALASRCHLHSQWLSVERDWRAVWQHWRGHGAPDWLITAGRKTHPPGLLLKWRHHCRILALTRPAWPLACFDALALPRHDDVAPRSNLLQTEGALNPVQPADDPDPGRGLILVGGPSRHFDWAGSELRQQINTLAGRQSDIQWTLSTSRRTPAGFLDSLRRDAPPNLQLWSAQDTPPGWVQQQLQHCATVWVSEDSVSMVYEALSAGARVGLLEMPRKHAGRVARGIDRLAQRQRVTRYSDFLTRGYHSDPDTGPLQEAARVADWLLSGCVPGGPR